MIVLLVVSFVSTGNAYGYTVLFKAVWSEHVSYDSNYFSLGEDTHIMGGINLDDPEISTATVRWDSTTIGLPLQNFLYGEALYITPLGYVPPTSFGDWENKTYTFEIDGIEAGNVFITPGTLRELSIPVTTYDNNTKTVSWQSVEFANTYLVRILRSANVDDYLFSSIRLGQEVNQYKFDSSYYPILDNGAIVSVEAWEFNPSYLANTSIYVTHSAPSIGEILSFYDYFVENEDLTGVGQGNSANGRLNALRNMLEMAGDFINIGDIEGACGQLHAASKKCDGESPPPDFVTGEAVSDLYNMIVELIAALGCE
jgi:hypothetical protein